MAGENLTGKWRVRAIRPAFADVARLCRRTKDRIEIRRHALKLRFFPEKNPLDEAGRVLDLDWSWVRGMGNLKIGELRIDDEIGGNNNLRIIFMKGLPVQGEPLPVIWVLRIMQKKRDDFSSYDLAVFRARYTLVMERFYKDR
jgi:hypothetical protein